MLLCFGLSVPLPRWLQKVSNSLSARLAVSPRKAKQDPMSALGVQQFLEVATERRKNAARHTIYIYILYIKLISIFDYIITIITIYIIYIYIFRAGHLRLFQIFLS